MPTLSWGVQWSACLSGLRHVTLVLQLLPFLWYGGLLLGLSSDWSPFHPCFSLLELSFGCVFLQASSSSRPGFWLSPEGSVFSPSLPAFLRIRFILCRFLLGAYFAEHFLIRSDLQKAVRIVPPWLPLSLIFFLRIRFLSFWRLDSISASIWFGAWSFSCLPFWG